MSGGIVEVNTACDLCNCNWRYGCDVEFTRKWGKPQIPPMCRRGLSPRQRRLDPDYKAWLDGAVLRVLRERAERHPDYRKLRAKQITKILAGKKQNYTHSRIPNFHKQSNHIRDSLHRLEREGWAESERTNGSKRWACTRVAESNREVGT